MEEHVHYHRKRRYSWLIIPLVLLMIYNLIPIIIMFVGSVKPSMALYNIPADLSLRHNVTLQNFRNVFKKVDMLTAMKNSFLDSILICLVTDVVGITGGYAFAKRNFRGKKFLFTLLMATMMLPKQIMMIPNYMVANQLHLVNKTIGLVLTSINSAYAIFMCRQYIRTIPDGLISAARLDGCSESDVFFQIILPMSKPVLGALTIFTFITSWNDFVWQNIMLTTKSLRTVPLALAYLVGQTDALTTLGNQMAGATLSAIPMLIIFLSFQKYFIEGIAAGSIKE